MLKVISDKNTLNQLNEWADKLVKRIQVELHNRNIDASGSLSDSLEYVIEDEGDGTHIKVLGNSYFIYSEKGRPAGKIPYNFTDILQQWIEDKGVAVPSKFKSAKQFAGAIAYTIKFYGSARYRKDDPADVVGHAVDELKPELNEILSNSIVYYINDTLFE